MDEEKKIETEGEKMDEEKKDEKTQGKFEEKEGETKEERGERLKKQYTRDHQLDQQLIDHARRVERNMRERIHKAKEQGLSEEQSKTPYADELGWTVKRMYEIGDAVEGMKRVTDRIENSVKTIKSDQIAIADALREIWQYLIMSQTSTCEWFGEKFVDYRDFVEEAKKKNKDD